MKHFQTAAIEVFGPLAPLLLFTLFGLIPTINGFPISPSLAKSYEFGPYATPLAYVFACIYTLYVDTISTTLSFVSPDIKHIAPDVRQGFATLNSLLTPGTTYYSTSLQHQHDIISHLHETNVITHAQQTVLALAYCNTPLQIPFNKDTLFSVVQGYCDIVYNKIMYVHHINGNAYLHAPHDFGSKQWCIDNYSVKDHPGALNKTGCYAHDMMCAIQKADDICLWNCILRNWFVFSDLTDDQVSGVLLYYRGAVRAYGYDLALRLGLLGVTDKDMAKTLSTVVKSLGWNSTFYGALVCELNTLCGRGVGCVDLETEVGRRTGIGGRAEVVVIDESQLRRAVNECYDNELSVTGLTSSSEWFQHRWLSLANGAHSRSIDRFSTYKHAGIAPKKIGVRMHRKAFSEQITEEQFHSWTGDVLVTPSQKLEHGKSRALFSCDSMSMMHFTWLLEHAEKDWNNIDAIIDPGRCGTIGIGALLYKMKSTHEYMAMQDFDDFNSQHSISAQTIVIDELCKRYNMNDRERHRLRDSFKHMNIVNGDNLTQVTGTLMSGHRGTTFINTVLNYAYMKIVHDNVGVRLTGKHVGDDIACGYKSLYDVDLVMIEARRIGLRLNRFKQSVGKYGMEFLRVAYDAHGDAFGYYSRAVASFVSGNWSVDKAMSPEEVLNSAVSAAYTLGNRCADRSIANCLVYAVGRKTGLKCAIIGNVLNGRVGLGDGPVFCNRVLTSVTSYLIRYPRSGVLNVPDNMATRATDAFAMSTTNTVDKICVERGHDRMRKLMANASYYKDMASAATTNEIKSSVVLTTRPRANLTRTIGLNEAIKCARLPQPELSSPLFMLLLRANEINIIKSVVHALRPGIAHNWHKYVNALPYGSNSFYGWLSYSDMMATNSKFKHTLITHNIGNYYV